MKKDNGTVEAAVASLEMVGPRLRAARERYGLSQRKLGKASGVSHATISLIEQGRLNPSIGILLSLLNAFPMSMAEFWQLPDTSPQKVFYKIDDLKKVRGKNVTFWQVGGGVTDNLMIFQYERYEPGADTGVTQLRKDGQESGFLISGRIELTIGDQRRVMYPGEAYYFNGRIPHRFRVIGKEPAIMVSCTVPPSF